MHQTIDGLAAVGLDVLVKGQENDRGGDGAGATRTRYREIVYGGVVWIALIEILHRFCGEVLQALQGEQGVAFYLTDFTL